MSNGDGVSALQDEKSAGGRWWYGLHIMHVFNTVELYT